MNETLIIALVIAGVPWSALLLPFHEHFNWNYQFTIARYIRVAQVVLLGVQLLALAYLVVGLIRIVTEL
jgi:hypothetical protein